MLVQCWLLLCRLDCPHRWPGSQLGPIMQGRIVKVSTIFCGDLHKIQRRHILMNLLRHFYKLEHLYAKIFIDG